MKFIIKIDDYNRREINDMKHKLDNPAVFKNKNNKVLNIERDGEYLTVQFERKDGQVVIGMYKNFGWYRMPTQELKNFVPIIRSYPRKFVGKRRSLVSHSNSE
jgi:hypothetical protein